jgi:hypothetical protein
MIKTGPQVPELTDLWNSMLHLHADLRLGSQVTHPQRESLSALTKELFAITQKLEATKYYVRDEPRQPAYPPLHPNLPPHNTEEPE